MPIGFGYDVHKFAEHRKLVLGGVEIPYDKGLLGYSDADALLHAICDALLGAASLGDIGTHFPDTDARYKNISSLVLLRQAGELVKQANFRVVNIDSTIVLQHPRLAPYIQRMRENIAEALQLDVSQVSVKATTTEGLGFTGTGEGAAAYAVALLEWH